MFGLPSGSSMWSALPWSAVIDAGAALRVHRLDHLRPGSASTVSIAFTAAGITPVWPTMSGLAKLMIPKPKSPLLQCSTNASAAASALISGLWS